MDTPTPLLHYDSSSKSFLFSCSSPPRCANDTFTIRRRGNVWCFSFPNRYPASLVGLRKFKSMFPESKASQPALEQINAIKQTRDDLQNEVLTRKLDSVFSGTTPYAHQREAIEHLLHCPKLALLLEQGLGKTYISIKALECLGALGVQTKTLVVCPQIVFGNWLREIAKFSKLRVVTYYGPDRAAQREIIQEGNWDIVLTTFDTVYDTRATKGMSLDVAKSLWESLSEANRESYASRWRAQGHVNNEGYALLTAPKDTAKWFSDCAKIVRGIPTYALPAGNYATAIRKNSNEHFLQSVGFDTLIVDEASRCIDHKSKRSRALDILSANTERTWLLSGTLCVGRPTDMYMPMHILDPRILGLEWEGFVKAYCCVSQYNKHVITGYRNVDKLKLLTGPYILSKEREQCLDLPKRIFVERYYRPSHALIKLYDSIVMEDSITYAGKFIHTKNILVKILKCMQVLSGFLYVDSGMGEYCNDCPNIVHCVETGTTPTSGTCLRPGGAPKLLREIMPLHENPKLEMLEEDLEDNVNEKTIIWAWYQQDLKDITEFLERKGIRYVTSQTRDCDRIFESDPNMRVFLGQTMQGIGITLNSATCTIYYSHGPALEPRLQSMDRNYRIGQTKPVIVKDYICAGSIEESIVRLLQHKKDVKDFMQRKVACVCCDRCMECCSKGVEYLKKGCKHEAAKNKAESKKTLYLRCLGD